MTSRNLVCFAHGKESGPWGTKITHLAEVARGHGYEVMSPDYSHT
ncbi:MAG: alpha/beta hydrolase, partial [Stenotrophobium sp.]